ncbi:MAG: hypothetical protein HWN68_13180 [Desulfobacterales bacterium]|nr:hypothetical protein [Desulfobacterales bacterium]
MSNFAQGKDNSAVLRNWTAVRLPARARGMDAPSQIKGLRGDVRRYVAQAIPQIDAEIAEKGHLWMETNYKSGKHNRRIAQI